MKKEEKKERAGTGVSQSVSQSVVRTEMAAALAEAAKARVASAAANFMMASCFVLRRWQRE